MGIGFHAVAMIAVFLCMLFPGHSPEVRAPYQRGCTMAGEGADHSSNFPPEATSMSARPSDSVADAPWYKQRNTQLRNVMRRYNPALTRAEINQAVYRMRIDPAKPMVALTFDDGPMPGVTDKILDILERYDARATFFVCGLAVSGRACAADRPAQSWLGMRNRQPLVRPQGYAAAEYR
ncbi:MAG: polysaccharide deacetylase family protein [Eubacteriales bacterium]